MTHLSRSVRLKGIESALTEYVTGTKDVIECKTALVHYGCDGDEADALIRSAPKLMKKRKKPRYRGDKLPFDKR